MRWGRCGRLLNDSRGARVRVIWLPFAAFVAAAAVLGYRAGRVPSETEIIEAQAARYVQERGNGARLTDCTARPGEGPVRIVLRCAHPAGDTTVMEIGLRGALLRQFEEISE